MKKFMSCFLFQKRPGERRALFWIWNWFFILLSGIGIGVLSMLLGIGHYNWEIFNGFFRHPLIALLNILPALLLVIFIYCLTGRAWISFLGAGVPIMLASAGNYFKLICRDDPFIFTDVTLIGTALRVSGNYDISLDARLLFCLLCLVFGSAFLFFFVRGNIGARFRLCGAAAVIIAVFPLSKVYTSENIYVNKTENYEFANRWSSTQVYISRGFIYPFLHSVPDAFPEKPEGYSESAALEILSAYSAEDIPEDKKVNIIGIQLEAFNDLERLGFTDINESVYAPFHTLESESYAGNLITNIFAGGTVDTERCFLTGYRSLDNFRSAAGSYAWYLKNQGYTVEGSHSCYDWFYNRKNVNQYLGFDNYYFYENRYSELADGNIALDDILIPDILKLYRERDSLAPYFNFSVTYQGHGPYTTTGLDWGDGYWTGEYENEETYYILNNYLGSVQNTGENLLELANELRYDEEPVLLVIFGDHNPWLGYGNSVYNELNINLDTATEQGFYNYYGTRYLIWANEAAKETLGNDFCGEAPDISPCFLMNVLFEQCSWGKGSEYMQLMSEIMELSPVLNTNGFYIENGALERSPSPGLEAALARLDIAQFFRKRNYEW